MNRASYALHGETSWKERKRTGIFVARDHDTKSPYDETFSISLALDFVRLFFYFFYFYADYLSECCQVELRGNIVDPRFIHGIIVEYNLYCINAITNPYMDYRFLVNNWNHKYLYDKKFLWEIDKKKSEDSSIHLAKKYQLINFFISTIINK